MNVLTIFGKTGMIAQAMRTAYELLPQQSDMEEAVEKELDSKTHLNVEAGTGGGKSLAYLVPRTRHTPGTRDKLPIFEYQVPQATLLFRQGFGRLIRAKTDKGAVVVLDSRIMTKNYGRSFLKSIPKCRITDERDELRRFFEGLGENCKVQSAKV